MAEAVRDFSEQDNVVDPEALTEAEDARYDYLDNQGRLSPEEIRAQILSERPKSKPVGMQAVSETISQPKRKSSAPHTHHVAGIQRSDSEVGPFALEPTGDYTLTPDQKAHLDTFREEAEQARMQREIEEGLSPIEAAARMRARREHREREQQ